MTEIPDAAVRAAIAEHARLLVDRPDPMVLSNETLFRRVLEAALPHLRERFADDIEAEGSPLCDCQGPDRSIPTNPATGRPMAHHCECRAVETSRAVRAGTGWTRHTLGCVCDFTEQGTRPVEEVAR